MAHRRIAVGRAKLETHDIPPNTIFAKRVSGIDLMLVPAAVHYLPIAAMPMREILLPVESPSLAASR